MHSHRCTNALCRESARGICIFLYLHLLAVYKEHQMGWNIIRNYIYFCIENSFENVARGTDAVNINWTQ